MIDSCLLLVDGISPQPPITVEAHANRGRRIMGGNFILGDSIGNLEFEISPKLCLETNSRGTRHNFREYYYPHRLSEVPSFFIVHQVATSNQLTHTTRHADSSCTRYFHFHSL